MNRRNWLQLSTALLVGCERSPQSSGATLQAGPFSVVVPPEWAKTAIVENRPIRPVFNAQEWAAFQADPAYALKPAYENRPQHWALRLPAAALPGSAFDANETDNDPEAPQILVHKADEWGVAFTEGSHEELSPAETIDRLRTGMKAAKGDGSAVKSPAFVDASLDFVCLKKVLFFSGGSGVRVVGQWAWESDLIRRGRLHYLFLGLSDDGTCQIIATFPLDHPDLPGESVEAEHLGRSASRYEELDRDFSAYRSEAKAWIEENADGFSPSLATLDGIVQSLAAERWE